MQRYKGIYRKSFKQSFRYVEEFTLDPSLASTAVYQTFSANGLYDPNISGTGHQPLGFDQLVGVVYNHYTVVGAKIKVYFMSTDEGSLGEALVGIQTSATIPISAALTTLVEDPGSKMGVLTNLDAKASTTLTANVSLSKFLGQNVIGEDDNAGSSSANPTEQVYFNVFAGSNQVGVTDPAKIQCIAVIDYIAVLHERKQLTGS